MIRENVIDRLTMALILDAGLKAEFVTSPNLRLEAIAGYNEKNRFSGGKVIELNEEESQLIKTLQATDVQQFISKLADILEQQQAQVSGSPRYRDISRLTTTAA